LKCNKGFAARKNRNQFSEGKLWNGSNLVSPPESQNALARALNVPPRRINEIVLEKRGITADTALRLARYFGTTAEMWTGLQADYDLRLVRYEKQKQIERDVEPLVLQPAMA
jgi:addiction module HigA family antidote